jgi:hypothetical protein
MRIHTSDKFIAWSALLSGLTVSAVAIYYSVAGLVAIFSAAVIPIIVMGVRIFLLMERNNGSNNQCNISK